ncbi:ABC transporter permease [Mesorhizobium sp. Cs1330R2N1]|uniref:ABC transporter permease n=2 Tax=Mesorhizobium argentiipisi TaxID=3015175 RepID=A0ABU8KAT6_9HYPH
MREERSKRRLSQEGIVFVLAVVLACGFAIILGDGFYRVDNIIALVRSVSVLGMLGLGMALVVIGRGIDLAMIATMVVAVSWALNLAQGGHDFYYALLLGAIFVILVGLTTGFLVAYAEVPAIFTTLAMGSVIFGVGRLFFFQLDSQNTPTGYDWFDFIGHGSIFTLPTINGNGVAIPTPIVLFALVAVLLFLALKFTIFGRYVYASGDNPLASRTAGIPTRVLTMAEYTVSSAVAYCAGIVMASAANGINTRIYNSTMIYDVLLIVVLGGIGLSGGRGGIRNVIVGTILVGVLLNGMTIMNVPYTVQNLVKSVTLLTALFIESAVNPRDEQTSQQGDI